MNYDELRREIDKNLRILTRSERGKRVIKHLEDFLERSGCEGLDGDGSRALVELLAATYGPVSGTATDRITETVGAIQADEI